MKHRSPTNTLLAEVALLLAIDRHGSATRAAAELGSTTATVLRRLEALEEALGCVLFDRLATGMRATPAMALVRPWAEQAEAIETAMASELRRVEQVPAGNVRLALPPAIATHVVVPALPALLAAFPDIVLEVAPAAATVDLVMREADVALRTVRPTQGDLVYRRLANVRLAVACAPGLTKETSTTSKPALAQLPWLAFDASLAHVPEMKWLHGAVPEARIVFRSTDLTSLLRAAQEGLGAVVVAEPLAVRAGGLVILETGTPMPEQALWLVTHRALRDVPRVAAVWEWLSSTLGGEASDDPTGAQAHATRRG